VSRPGRWASLVLLVGSLPGCHPEVSQTPSLTLEQAAEKVNFGSEATLGSHRSEVSVIRRVRFSSGEVEQTDQQAVLVWQDWDNFQFRRLQGGNVTCDNLVVGGLAWNRGPKGHRVRVPDAEPLRADLRVVWDAWTEALGPFSGRIALVRGEAGVIEGRPARPYGVTLGAQPGGGSRPSVEPLDLTGTVWLDEATAVRLLADVEGSWRRSGDAKRIQEVSFHLAISGIGQPQDLQAPRRGRRPSAEGEKPAPSSGAGSAVADRALPL